ncbi:MAG: hypothetical protein ACR2OH_07775 [Microthrixaceae bacterium]
MTASEFLLVCAAVLGVMAFAAGSVALWVSAARMRSAASALEQATDEFGEATGVLVDQLSRSAEVAAGEVERVEYLLDLSEGIAERIDGTTAATYKAITSPVIKGAAFAEGTRRAAQRLGGRRAVDAASEKRPRRRRH